MTSSILTPEELTQLKALLPFGSKAKIAKNAGVTRESVKRVLNGDWFNAAIYVEAFKIAEAEKKKRENLANKFKAIIQP
ncbi:MAG: hypothetical protein RJA25_2235 [Bacteroidota bacterium]|jgi:hypothetical protein